MKTDGLLRGLRDVGSGRGRAKGSVRRGLRDIHK